MKIPRFGAIAKISLALAVFFTGSRLFASDSPATKAEDKPVQQRAADTRAPQANEKQPAKAEDKQPSKADQKPVTVEDSRKELAEAAKAAGADQKRVSKFCKELESRASKYKVSDEQIIAAYKSVTALLSAADKDSYCPQAERTKLAEELLHNLAYPREIDQGTHPTCNVTTVEVYMASRHPDVYADLVKQVALTQKYKTKTGDVVNLPKKALAPGIDEKAYDIDAPGQDKRNRASQFVEMTLVNGVYETGRFIRAGTATNKDYRYILGPQNIHTEWDQQYGWVTVYDTEDQLLDGQGNQVIENGKGVDSPQFITEDILQASEMVLGYKMPYVASPYKIGNQPWVYDLPDAKRLLQLKDDGKLPLGVPTKGGIHVQTIHDVYVDKQGTCWVLIDDQHGSSKDGWITLDELHKTQQDANYSLPVRDKHPE